MPIERLPYITQLKKPKPAITPSMFSRLGEGRHKAIPVQ